MEAVEWNTPEVVDALLDAGASAPGGVDVDARDAHGWTALILTAWRKAPDPEVVKRLLRAGADANASNRYGETALMWAAEWDVPEAVKLLLDAGARVDARDGEGRTALMWAHSPEAVRLLLDAGANPNLRDNYGQRAVRGQET